MLLAEDETDLLLFPPLRACWSLRGQPAEVRLSGWNARRVVFGAMNLRNGSRLFLARERQRAEDFQVFLEVIHHYYRGWHVALLLDEDPSHTAKESVAVGRGLWHGLAVAAEACPELNPMDTLWGQGKDRMSANKQYATIDEQVDRFLDYLAELVEEGGVAYGRCSLQELLVEEGVVKKLLRTCLGLRTAVRVQRRNWLSSRR